MNDHDNPNAPSVASPEPAATDTPTTTPVGVTEAPLQPAGVGESGVWVPRAQYDALVTSAEAQRSATIDQSAKLKTFYTLLTVTGLALFILYIGMLIWPFEYISKGNCTTGFSGIAFWLNPAAYIMLLATGIFGATLKHKVVRPLSIVFIVLSVPAWFFTGLVILTPMLCGV